MLPSPKQHLVNAKKKYDLKMSDRFVLSKGAGGLSDWPNWCYLPMAGWLAITSKSQGRNWPNHQDAQEVAGVSALGTWRVTQGIYTFDETLLDALWDTKIEGDLPCDTFYQLPEWCVYVDLQNKEDFPGNGFFAHLEYDVNTGRHELRFMVDLAPELPMMPLILHLGQWGILESIQRSLITSVSHAADEIKEHFKKHGEESQQPIKKMVTPMVSLLIYICSQQDHIDGPGQPRKPGMKKVRGGFKSFEPREIKSWDVGARLGASLRKAYAANQDPENSEPGERERPRPHIRRAHWHGYWTGPRDGERKMTVKWQPPIAVNLSDFDDLPVVERKVK